MFTVALIGPDGAGKSTVGRRVEAEFPLPIKYIYEGIVLESSNFLLPTTRAFLWGKQKLRRQNPAASMGPTAVSSGQRRSRGTAQRIAAGISANLHIANLMAEQLYRQILAWFYRRRGYILLLDRHSYLEYCVADTVVNSTAQPLAMRLQGLLLEQYHVKLDLVIYLDAPANLLFERKGEGSPERLDELRRRYAQLQDRVEHFATVDAAQPVEMVTRDVVAILESFYQSRGDGASNRLTNQGSDPLAPDRLSRLEP
jgi:thymidylate kinase